MGCVDSRNAKEIKNEFKAKSPSANEEIINNKNPPSSNTKHNDNKDIIPSIQHALAPNYPTPEQPQNTQSNLTFANTISINKSVVQCKVDNHKIYAHNLDAQCKLDGFPVDMYGTNNNDKLIRRYIFSTDECWVCPDPSCSTINNLKLCIEKYNMQCYGCNNTKYVPDNTKIISSTKWNTSKDYQIKHKLIKPVWICTYCSYENDNIRSDVCHICEQLKSLESKYKFIPNVSSNYTIIWICQFCSYNNRGINGSKCEMCKALKPKNFVVHDVLLC